MSDPSAIASTIVRPADGAPAGCATEKGKYRIVWLHDGGRNPEMVGPPFDRPREAILVAEVLNARR